MSSNKPVHELRLGRIRAAVWRNDNPAGPAYSVTFSRLYKDEETGKWDDSTSFSRDDLLLLAKVADLTHSWVYEQQQRDRPAQDEPQPA